MKISDMIITVDKDTLDPIFTCTLQMNVGEIERETIRHPDVDVYHLIGKRFVELLEQHYPKRNPAKILQFPSNDK